MTNYGKDLPTTNMVGFLNDIKMYSKNDITDIAMDIIQMVNDGMVNPLDLQIKLKVINEITEMINKSCKGLALDEAYKSKSQGEYLGHKIEIRNSGDRLCYEDDPIYTDLKNKLKARENLLKTAYKNTGTIIFDEDGIEVPIVSCVVGKETLYITLK